MNQTTPARLACLAAFPVLLGLGALVAPPTTTPLQATDVKTVGVTDSIHYLVGGGGNVGVMLGPDGVLMVDDLFERNAKAIQDAITKLGGDKPVWLVNTHWHGDHTGGNAKFGEAANIVAHTNVRRRLAGDAGIGGRVATAEPAAHALPVVTHENGMSLFVNGEEVRLLHHGAAHTDGDSVVWFTGSKVVHMGDLFFNLGYPFIDLDSGGDVHGVIATCEKVIELVPADTQIIPGHGDHTDVEGLKTYVAMIKTSLERVEKAVADGKTVEQMMADGIVDDLNDRWGGFSFVPPAGWVQMLTNYVSAER